MITQARAGFPPSHKVEVWQLLPHTARNAHVSDQIWWNTQAIVGLNYRRPIRVGFVFQSLGAGETSDDNVAIRKATQMVNERFQLPMIHTFLRV